ncbi:MAG: response regulator transcription factor [Desulfobacteraceae bacterium]|nr:response regulator transcription factor [Desulfobacteraceae bacterium]
MRLLLIEEDTHIASFIHKGMRESGFAVDHAKDGEDGLHLALTELYDAMIVDLMLPKMNGLWIIETMRMQQINSPVIILSSKLTLDDRIRGLQAGGDDYLTKPFDFPELLVRVQSLIRRTTRISEANTITCGDLSMDLVTREVKRAGKFITLQPREFSLLEFMMRNQDKVLSKTMIMEQVWDYHFDPGTNVVEVRMCKLREKINKGFGQKLINTVYGAGYVLKKICDQ